MPVKWTRPRTQSAPKADKPAKPAADKAKGKAKGKGKGKEAK